MPKTTFSRAFMTGRLADTVGAELALSLITVAAVTALSVWRLDGVWLYLVPAAAGVYSAVRIGLVVARNNRQTAQDA